MREFIVDETNQLKRLDQVATELLPEFSRSYIQTLINEENIRVNAAPSKANYRVKNGDRIQFTDVEAVDLTLQPVDLKLDIVYEDQDIIVINKPKGLIVHPSASSKNQVTLVNGLLFHCHDLSGINGVNRPGIVHRIDKDTSGLIVVAKTDLAHHDLSEQLKNKTMKRSYYALVHGEFPHAFAKVDAPIGRDEKDRLRMSVSAKNSKHAVTHLQRIETFKDYTLLECHLETGRTHQIRVHLKYIGYPIVGDPKYAGKNEFGLVGQCLHAYQLDLIHPRTREAMVFTAPLPESFESLLAVLRGR